MDLHARGVAQAIVVALGVVLFVVGVVVQRRRERAEARREAALWSSTVNEPAEGPTALRGEYRQWGKDRWLLSGGLRIELDGPPIVVRGSVVRWDGERFRQELRDGDIVIARGVMVRAADTATGDYRSHQGGWRLREVELHAVEPPPVPRPTARVMLALVAITITTWSWLAVKRASFAKPNPSCVMMPAIPDATVKRWETAMHVLCPDVVVTPQQDLSYLTTPTVLISCKSSPNGPMHLDTYVQLDDDGLPNRVVASLSLAEGNPWHLVKLLFDAYGMPAAITNAVMAKWMQRSNVTVVSDAMHVMVHVETGRALVTITNPDD